MSLAALLNKRGLLPPAFLRQKFEAEVNEPVADKIDAHTHDKTRAPLFEPMTSPSDDDWRAQAQVIADRIGLEKYRTGMQQITARNICDAVASELALEKTTWGLQGPRGADNVRNEGLRGWKFTPPKEAQKVD